MTGYATNNFTSAVGCNLTSESFFKVNYHDFIDGEWLLILPYIGCSAVVWSVYQHTANMSYKFCRPSGQTSCGKPDSGLPESIVSTINPMSLNE
jgi:hypothetical protein